MASLTFVALIRSSAFASGSSQVVAQRSAILQDRCTGLSSQRPVPGAAGAIAEVVSGLMYDRGCGVTQNMVLAERHFEAAVSVGSKDPLATGYVALYGAGASSNGDKGVAILSDAADTGNAFAASMLEWYFCHRHIKNGDDSTSFHWATVGSHLGDMRASADLGADYLFAGGTTQDVLRGKSLLEAASAAGDSSADANLGFAYMNGTGYAKDTKKGIASFQRAIGEGSTLAKSMYATALSNSDLGSKPPYRSLLLPLTTEAAEALYPHSMFEAVLGWLDVMYGTTAADRQRGVALTKANVDLTSYLPDRVMGYCYLYGVGVSQDIDRAVDYLKSAQAKGSPDAVDALKVIAELRESAQANAAAAGSYDQRQDYWRSQQIPGMQTPDMRPAAGMPLPGSAAYPQSH